MERSKPLMIGETYHIFNRGAHKQPIFLDEHDHRRFQILLFLANRDVPVNLRSKKYKGESFAEIFEGRDGAKLVDVLSYALLPNHFHLVLRQLVDTGISTCMRKLCTGYSMHFNLRHTHSGTLFQGPFKSRHIDTDPYFKWIFPYVHLNPISLVEPLWEDKKIQNLRYVRDFLSNYAYSSFRDYYGPERPERAILAFNDVAGLIDTKSDLEGLLSDYARGQALYRETPENRP